MTFFFVWQTEFGTCFGVAPSAYRSVYAALIFRSFESSPWYVVAWKWLLEKHPIARQAFFAVSSLSKRAIDSPQTSWSIFTLLVIQVKIVVIEPAKPISARCFR